MTAERFPPSVCSNSQAGVVDAFSQGGADVADRPRGWSLLHLAAALGQEASVAFLLAKKLPVNGGAYPFTLLFGMKAL